jgi:hypothetical protein
LVVSEAVAAGFEEGEEEDGIPEARDAVTALGRYTTWDRD